jgi:uncharacterized protein YdaU (DUF1376 family)
MEGATKNPFQFYFSKKKKNDISFLITHFYFYVKGEWHHKFP